MKALEVSFPEFGVPSEVLQVNDLVKTARLGNNEIRVKVEFSPINPADINYIQGTYGVKPELPAVPGMEASGVVIESNSESVRVGDRVIFIERAGAWSSEVICDSKAVYVFPDNVSVPSEQASMLKVNPLTALRLLEGFVGLNAGDYVIQNAANSGVGQCVIQVAKQLGLKTINLVRREGLEKDLIAMGADHVLLDDGDMVAKVREICGESLPKLACNAVGGDSALRLMDAIAEMGTHVTYGAMSLRSLKVPNKFLIFKRITLKGLWVTEWLKESSKADVDAAYTQLATWISEGKLTQAIDTVYSPKEASQAVTHAMQSKRKGKILLRFN